ncbi:MAG TPA: Ig-like domain repeat protein [Solirubrobacterales bacterium]|nr:Ig-like domain repeat protein [Solirubrobacterales bacterium]
MNGRRFVAVSLFLLAVTVLTPFAATADTVEDTQPPQLLGLSIEPDEVDTTASDQKVTFTAHVSDDLAGTDSVGIGLTSPSETQVIVEGLNFVSGTATDAIYSGTLTIPRFAETGAWRVTNVYLHDSARNGDVLHTAELEALGLPSTVLVNPAPAVIAIQPASGPASGGTEVEITGTGLGSATTVSFGTAPSTFTVDSATSITAIAPPGLGAVDVVVTTPNGTSVTSAATQFTYEPNAMDVRVELSSSPNPSVVNQKITFVTKVSPLTEGAPAPEGTVSFVEGTTTLAVAPLNAEGVAKVNLNSLPVGQHSIAARYGGDANFRPRESTPVVQVVGKATTQLALESSRNPARYNAQATLRANITTAQPGQLSPTGTVTFLQNGASVATIPLEGKKFATYSLKGTLPGVYQFQAIFSGDGDYEASESASLTQMITP